MQIIRILSADIEEDIELLSLGNLSESRDELIKSFGEVEIKCDGFRTRHD